MEKVETSILLAIRPEFVRLIFNGLKKFELRRVLPKEKNINRVYIYETAPMSKIVGYFDILEMVEANIELIWDKTKESNYLNKIEFDNYYQGKNKGFYIKIGKRFVYNDPKSLNEFKLKSAPQNFIYFKDDLE